MRVSRMLSILLIILKKGKVTGKELAEHFEVSLRTIYRDIEKIGEAGIPIASFGGKGGGYYIMDSYKVNNLFLNNREANIFIEVMNNLDFLFGSNNQFNDVVLKFENTYKKSSNLTDNLNINMSHFSMEQELVQYLGIMNKSIEESRLLVFEYVNRNLEYKERTVEPLQIEFYKGHWYLIGFCRLRDDFRRFKLVRIRNLRIGEFFVGQSLTTVEINQILDDGFRKQSINIALKFSNRIGEQLTEYFSVDKITRLEDGHFLVEDSYPNNEGLIKFILGFGLDCEVLKPTELRDEVKEYTKNLYLQYND
ncbi:YafY family protein [Bacillus sp. 31A1R]|uniref:YafY family protein n=1 Tax=Robertmurraya mangrovi TaxID=3098077 RepID=A0ABU5J0Z1_9BACI|nr:YafY family protein [Bacillus sp. 31A1R]MDZ5473074.1 YafY family protein [Bacillus sp. 31A1R]